MRLVAKIIVALACLFFANAASAVTGAKGAKGTDRDDAMTTGAATRARADVQIRRIRDLLVSKTTTDDDKAYEQMEKLQKQLRGEN